MFKGPISKNKRNKNVALSPLCGAKGIFFLFFSMINLKNMAIYNVKT